jgi:bifunctional non-homologous end joining protein LigD
VSADVKAVVAGITISNAGRVMYPDPVITKLDLARYYERVSEWMLPHIANRPLSLVACPAGITGDCMYIKHGKAPALRALRRIAIAERTKVDDYLVLDSVEGLVSLMQMNWLEAHTWNSTTADLEHPDRLVFDLDPGPDVGWPSVVRAARTTRDAIAARGLRAWVKTSGGRGLHVVVPIVPEASWDTCLSFSERVAADLVDEDADTFTTQFARSGREGQIFVDVLRNRRGSTVVCAFSPRARPGAPVSVPQAWDELSPGRTPAHYTVRSVPRRLAALRSDPWADYWQCLQHVPSTA